MKHSRPSSLDFVPLQERLRYLRLFRLLAALVVLACWPLLAGTRHVGLQALVVGTVGFVLLAFAAEGLWRARRQRGRHIQSVMLLIDGLYLAAVGYAMGGMTNPLRALILLHLIAVALLASFRTGLKLAMWHSLLLFSTIYAMEAGLLADFGQSAELWGPEFRLVLVWTAAFWLAAFATASFAAVNERELRRQRYDSQALAQFAYYLERETRPEPIAAGIVNAVADDLEFSRVVLFRLDVGELQLIGDRGASKAETDRELPGASSPARRALTSRATVLTGQKEARDDSWLLEWLSDPCNLVLVPLQAENRVLGLLVAEYNARRDSRIEQRLVTMLERFTSQGAMALGNAWLLEEIERAATTDGLTGLANRGYLESELGRELARAERTGEPVSLIMLDIDHFKALNDTCGHPAGDAALRAVADAMGEACRESDLVARYGGEEFAAVLPGTDEEGAVEIAERLRLRISRLEAAVPVTASFGVAGYPRSAFDLESLIRAADSALYVSKQSGRNRTTAVSSPASASDATRGEKNSETPVRETPDADLLDRSLRDSVTGLANRPLFLDRLGLALARARRDRTCVAVVLVDLDRFKEINDSLGHEWGDRALVVIARRLDQASRAGENVARIGGDEFGIVCELDDEEEALVVARRIQEGLQEPLNLDGEEVSVSVSLGSALAVEGQARPQDLLRDAETAVRRAKELGGARSETFDPALRERILGRISLEKELKQAIEHDEFSVVYQPRLRLQDRQLVGFEGLVRWNHPERGLVSPADFIPLAEETGFIVPLEAFVLEEACRQSARWRTAHPELELEMAVNLSARHLAHPSLLATLENVLTETGIDAESLTLEITERTVTSDPESVAATVRVIKGLGVCMAIDDFGTGYSSLGSLRQLPFDQVKIDRSFVAGLGVRSEDRAIVEAVKGMADALGLSTVAEGIETEEQLETLITLGCETGQGHLFSAPRSADLAGELLPANGTIAASISQRRVSDVP